MGSDINSEQSMTPYPDPNMILQTTMAFWPSKVLLTAVEMDLFSILSDTSMTAPELGKRLGLHPRGTFVFFDALFALGFLQRNGDGATGRYQNTRQQPPFLVVAVQPGSAGC